MKVELLKAPDTDLDIANAARVSYDKESDWDWSACKGLECETLTGCSYMGVHRALRPADAGLIRYLMREHHGTPFEMVDFKFRVRVPIGVAREWMRHRIGSYNEVSTRYVKMDDEFYLPAGDALRTQVGKPGHYTFEPLPLSVAALTAQRMSRAYSEAYGAYCALLEQGAAKEVARNVLPLGLYTQFIWKINGRSLMNFLSLRLAPNALLEIRQCAEQVYELVKPVTPVMWEAWEQYRRPGGESFHDCDACDVHAA
jgi:thymidylate synthase (FAD)